MSPEMISHKYQAPERSGAFPYPFLPPFGTNGENDGTNPVSDPITAPCSLGRRFLRRFPDWGGFFRFRAEKVDALRMIFYNEQQIIARRMERWISEND